jgi:hypothetical protein
MKTTLLMPVLALAGLAMLPTAARADDVLYGNNAGYGPDIVDKFDINIGAGTATLLQTYNVSSGNGRAIVVLNNVMYTTQVSDSTIYETNVTTGLSMGTISTPVETSTLAWDGTEFWAAQYVGGTAGDAYRIDTSGNVTSTINLGGFDDKDGLEFFNGKLIGNEGDAQDPYDVYSTSGTLLTSHFITPSVQDTGIAFDGTDFITSNIFDNSISVWDGSTGAFIKTIDLPGTGYLIEDLSVNYNTTTNRTAPDGGSTLLLLGIATLSGALLRRRMLAA